MADERTPEASERDGGSTGVALAIGGIIVAFFATMPFLFLVVLYLFLTGYAIVRAIGPGAGQNAVTIVIGFVVITTLFAIGIAVTINLVGRSFTPKKRRKSA